jgi:hypothetical protein
MNNSIAIALDQHDKQKEAPAACDASLNFTHSPLCRRASRAATPRRSPSRDQGWKSRPNPSGARFLQFNEGRLPLRRRVDHAGRVADGEANPLAIFADGKFESISLHRRVSKLSVPLLLVAGVRRATGIPAPARSSRWVLAPQHVQA